MKYLSYVFKVVPLVLISLVFNTQVAFAHDSGYWDTNPNKVWKTGTGDCWRTINWSAEAGGCGEAPAPAEKEITGYFWPDDQDQDGVLDLYDRCPFTPPGVKVDENGCANDTDGDGVPDYLDKCPETPLGKVVDTNGCHRVLVSLSGIHFDFDSAQLTSEAKRILDDALSSIKSSTSSNISVEGHTDSKGSDDYNLGLSQRRAESVVNYLVSQGVSSSVLNAVGKGESYPIASNDTRDGRHENRRVEVIAR